MSGRRRKRARISGPDDSAIVTINVDSLRHKVAYVKRAVDAFRARGAKVNVVCITESRLHAGIQSRSVDLPGFHIAVRRDRGRDTGGGVLIYAADGITAYESWKAPADSNTEAAEITILKSDNTQAARILVAYRPPGNGVAVFSAIRTRAAAAAADGTPFFAMGDLNARGFDEARQEGPWRRARKGHGAVRRSGDRRRIAELGRARGRCPRPSIAPI